MDANGVPFASRWPKHRRETFDYAGIIDVVGTEAASDRKPAKDGCR